MTEAEWQSAKTSSALGQVGKFVLNYDDDGETVTSVRLPAVVNVQGLMDLSNLGITVDESLPNITGTYATTPGVNHLSWCTGAMQTSSWLETDAEEKFGNGTYFDAVKAPFNAHNSSAVYQDGAHVQPEAIQYPYFIQIATGQETDVDITNEIELNNPFTLFDSKYSEAPLHNASWLLSNGTFYAKSVYTTAYEALAVENNTGVEAGTSVTLPSGTEYVKRGLSVKLSTDEDITDYDFVLNTSDETFRLPVKSHLASGNKGSITGSATLSGTVPVVGNGKMLGLNGNNLSGSNTGFILSGGGSDTQLYTEQVSNPLNAGADGGSSWANTQAIGVTTDASKSGLVANLSSANVETSNLSVDLSGNEDLLLYYYVGETIQNANLINAGRMAEILPTKLDNDEFYNKLTNCILEIPQRIKYTLENGTLTIKAGSVAIVPYGTTDQSSTYPIGSTFFNDNFKVVDTQFFNNKFFVWVEVQEDVSISSVGTVSSTGSFLFLDPDSNGFIYFQHTSCNSGTTKPSTGQCWYDTANNLIKDIQTDSDIILNSSFPILSFTREAGAIQTVITVYNGTGYIGGVRWVDKGVEGIFSNNAGVFRTDKLLLCDQTGARDPVVWVLTPTGNNIGAFYTVDLDTYTIAETVPTTSRWYSISQGKFFVNRGDNENPDWEEDPQAWIAFGSTSSSTTTSYASFNEASLLKWQDLKLAMNQYLTPYNKSYITQTYVSGTSWYRIWSDGWCEQGGRTARGGSVNINVTFLKKFANTNYTVLVTLTNITTAPNTSGDANNDTVGSYTTAGMTVRTDSNFAVSWVAMGKLASGQY